jgi:hypothetical protein
VRAGRRRCATAHLAFDMLLGMARHEHRRHQSVLKVDLPERLPRAVPKLCGRPDTLIYIKQSPLLDSELRATASAVRCDFPVSITISTPECFKACDDLRRANEWYRVKSALRGVTEVRSSPPKRN